MINLVFSSCVGRCPHDFMTRLMGKDGTSHNQLVADTKIKISTFSFMLSSSCRLMTVSKSALLLPILAKITLSKNTEQKLEIATKEIDYTFNSSNLISFLTYGFLSAETLRFSAPIFVSYIIYKYIIFIYFFFFYRC